MALLSHLEPLMCNNYASQFWEDVAKISTRKKREVVVALTEISPLELQPRQLDHELGNEGWLAQSRTISETNWNSGLNAELLII